MATKFSEIYAERLAFWRDQGKRRREAKVGDIVDFGRCNFGRDQLILPVVRITKTQLVCSDGNRTERVMIESGRYVGSIDNAIMKDSP